MLHEVAIDFGVWIKPSMQGWNARIYYECHYIIKQTFSMILLLSWWFVEPLNLQICHIFKPSENIWWQRRSKWISIKMSVKVNSLKWVAIIWWLHEGWYEVRNLTPYKLWWTTDVDCDERVFSEYLQRLYASWLEIEVSQRLMSRTQHELRFTLLRLTASH